MRYPVTKCEKYAIRLLNVRNMKAVKIIIIILCLIFFTLPLSVYATRQSSDIVIYEGEKYYFYYESDSPDFPLEAYFKNTGKERPKFRRKKPTPKGMEVCLSTNNWRGYIATWEISENQLFLKEIDSFIEDEKVTLEKLFKEKVQDARVLASWFSGKIKISINKETYLVFEIKDGRLIKINKVLTNR